MSLYIVRIGKRLIYKYDTPEVAAPNALARVVAYVADRAKARGWDRLPSQARDVWAARVKRWLGY
jgi:hypothetical protein